LANLVDNAIKYAKPHAEAVNGAEILLTAQGEGDRILLAVADRGPGIPQADRGRAVERFVRLEQSRSEPGSGLGLSLAAAVAHRRGRRRDPARPRRLVRFARDRAVRAVLPGRSAGDGRRRSLARRFGAAARHADLLVADHAAGRELRVRPTDRSGQRADLRRL